MADVYGGAYTQKQKNLRTNQIPTSQYFLPVALKLLEWLMLRRLTSYLDAARTLPTELCGFRAKRCIADAIGDIASTSEQARACHQSVLCIPGHAQGV